MQCAAFACDEQLLYRNFGKNDSADFRMVSGILRLATKYLVDSLRTKALVHLSRAWPTSLKGWDAREDLARADEMQSGPGMSSVYPSPAVGCLS
jgi:hypothetical protein